MKRAWPSLLTFSLATTLLFACSFVRDLDYLTNGSDAGTTPTHEAGTSTSSSSSSGGQSDSDAGPTVGEVIATNQYKPEDLMQDASNLYWTTDDNKVMKLAKAGGQPVVLATLSTDGVEQIIRAAIDVADTGSVYALLESGAIKVVPKAGGTPTDLPALAAPMSGIAIAVDDTSVFVLASSDPSSDDLAILYRFSKVAPFTVTELSRMGTAGTALFLSSTSVFWAVTSADANSDDVVLELPLTAAANSGPTAMAHGNTTTDSGTAVGITPPAQTEIVLDGTTFFWADESEYKIYSQPLLPLIGKATALFAATSGDSFDGVVVDDTNVYFTDVDGDSNSVLRRVPKVGGEPETINVAVNPTELAFDATYLYVAFNNDISTDGTQGGIARFAK